MSNFSDQFIQEERNQSFVRRTETNCDNISFWSKVPGCFVTKGKELVVVSETTVDTKPKTVVRVLQEKEVAVMASPGHQFYGTLREWYETLPDLITAIVDTLSKRHLQAPGVLEVSPEVLTILEHCLGYKANYKLNEKGDFIEPTEVLPITRGVWVGTLNNRLKVVKVEAMPSDEAHVVLITKVIANNLLTEASTPKIFEMDNLSSEQRIDQWVIKILDMNKL